MTGSTAGSDPTVINVWLRDYPATALLPAQARDSRVRDGFHGAAELSPGTLIDALHNASVSLH